MKRIRNPFKGRASALGQRLTGRIRNRLVTDTLREVHHTFPRFLSLLVLSALAVCFLAGLRATAPDMKLSADAYFDQQNVYDINVQSTYGLTRDDLAAIQEVDGVETAEGIYTETAYTAVGTTRERVVVQSLSKENIDQPVLVNGDLPESADEVAVTSKFLKASGKKLGDTVSFAANDASSSNQSAKDQFAAGDYTITAEVLDPTDVSSDSTVNAFRAASAADYKFYVSEDAATSSSYSAVHVIVEGAKSLNSYSDAYTTKINEVKGNIEKIREEREKARVQELTVDTPTSLDTAERQAAILKAEGEAQAILNVQKALADSIKMLNEANPNDQVVKIKALESFEKAADGQATKIIVPSEIQSLAGLAASFKGLLEDEKK